MEIILPRGQQQPAGAWLAQQIAQADTAPDASAGRAAAAYRETASRGRLILGPPHGLDLRV